MAEYPQTWMTDENPARVLFVRGRNSWDPDVLVAYADSADKEPLWIVDHRPKPCPVIGLPKKSCGDFVRATRMP
jgi:hypothetical protein